MSAPWPPSEVSTALNDVYAGVSDRKTSWACIALARRMALLENSERGQHLIDEHAPRLIVTLLRLIKIERTHLNLLDNYVYLLTTVRMATTRKHAVNVLILPQIPDLIGAFEFAFSQDPGGYAGPELVSMWSSMINDSGADICRPHMACLAPILRRVALAHSVASVVAALCLANIDCQSPETISIFTAPASIPLMQLASAIRGLSSDS